MGEDDIVEFLWHNGQIVRRSQTQRPISDTPSAPTPIFRGSGSGSGEGNAPLPLPQPPHHYQNLFIQEDEMASWLYHPRIYSDLLYSNVVSSTDSLPQSSVSLALPPLFSAPTMTQIVAANREENLMNFSWLRGNISTGGRVEPGPPIPVVRESVPVGSSSIPSSSAHDTNTQATAIGRVSQSFAIPDLCRKTTALAIQTDCEIAGTSSSGVPKAETELIEIYPSTETETADERKLKESEETTNKTEENEEACSSTSRKRSRAAELHNLSERKRREKINKNMKALQELIPRCNKTDKAAMLEDAIEYVKSLQMQIQMMSRGCNMMPVMYPPNTMPHMAIGMMGMNRPSSLPFPGTPFPRQPHMADYRPSNSAPPPYYPFPSIQASDPSSQQPNPVSNQPLFPGYINPYSQLGLQQMQQQPPLQNQTKTQLSFSQASSSK